MTYIQAGPPLPVYIANRTPQIAGPPQPVVLVDTSGNPLLAVNVSAYTQTLLSAADAATARGTLGAQTAVPLGRPKTGSTYGFVIPGVEATGVATAVLTANQVRYEPFYVATQITIDQLALEVTSTGGAGKLVRVGIYNADGDLQPTSLVYDAGTIAADSVTAQTISLGVAQTLSPGRYLFALNSDGTPTLRCLRAGSMLSGFAAAFGASPFVVSLTAAQTYGAFPGTGLAWTALNAGGGSPAVHCVICRVSTP